MYLPPSPSLSCQISRKLTILATVTSLICRICKNVAVMRRRSDGWLNATQILKVAGFDKPQRTRVLEREVQKGEHEKVQGGYGKYQGTSQTRCPEEGGPNYQKGAKR
jgi:hypothetical protein